MFRLRNWHYSQAPYRRGTTQPSMPDQLQRTRYTSNGYPTPSTQYPTADKAPNQTPKATPKPPQNEISEPATAEPTYQSTSPPQEKDGFELEGDERSGSGSFTSLEG